MGNEWIVCLLLVFWGLLAMLQGEQKIKSKKVPMQVMIVFYISLVLTSNLTLKVTTAYVAPLKTNKPPLTNKLN